MSQDLDKQFKAGSHKLPVKAEVRKAIAKEAGDGVSVRLEERL